MLRREPLVALNPQIRTRRYLAVEQNSYVERVQALLGTRCARIRAGKALLLPPERRSLVALVMYLRQQFPVVSLCDHYRYVLRKMSCRHCSRSAVRLVSWPRIWIKYEPTLGSSLVGWHVADELENEACAAVRLLRITASSLEPNDDCSPALMCTHCARAVVVNRRCALLEYGIRLPKDAERFCVLIHEVFVDAGNLFDGYSLRTEIETFSKIKYGEHNQHTLDLIREQGQILKNTCKVRMTALHMLNTKRACFQKKIVIHTVQRLLPIRLASCVRSER